MPLPLESEAVFDSLWMVWLVLSGAFEEVGPERFELACLIQRSLLLPGIQPQRL